MPKFPAHLFNSRCKVLSGSAVLVFALSFTVQQAHGQVSTGEIDGIIRDKTGAVIPNAVVVITNTDQNLVARTIKTDARGQFTAPLLTIGTYQIEVSAAGFEHEAVTGVEVHVGTPSAIPVELVPGGTSESVTVTVGASENAPQLDTAAAGTLISAEQATQLPLSDRNFIQLLTIQPGISSGIPGRNNRGNIQPSGAVNTQNFSVNGNPNTGNGFYVDGADTIKRAGQQPVAYPSVDFIQETNLQRANYGAEYGGPGSSVILVQTKAGGTAFHGGVFYFLRSTVLDANSYFNKLAGLPRGGERFNDYGFNIGGPVFIPGLIKRGNTKTFFFFGQEYLRSQIAISQNVSNIPTLAQRSGQFTTPVCLVFAAGKCTNGTQVPTIDVTAQQYLTDVINHVPLPNNPADPQGLIYNSPGTNNETQTLIRIDQQLGSKLSVFFRFLNDPFDLTVPNGFQVTSQIPGVATQAITNGSTNWLGHFTYLLGAKHVFEGGYASRQNYVTAHSTGLLALNRATDISIRLPYVNQLDHVPVLAIGGSNYNVSGPYDERSPVQQIFLNNTNALGRHTLKLGFNVELEQQGSNQGAANSGNFTFTAANTPAGTTVFAQAFSQFLQGQVSNFTQANKDIASNSNLNIYEGYVQDDYHATPKLTMTLGLRYTYFAAGSGASFKNYPYLAPLNFLPSAYNPAQAPTLTPTGTICTALPCAGGGIPNPNYNPLNGIIAGGTTSPFGATVAHAPKDNFAPRFGFTYDVFGNGRTAIRGGFGIFEFSQIGNPTKFATNGNPPNVTSTTISNASFANPAGGVISLSATPQTLQGYAAEAHNPYNESYNLDVQQQIRPGTVFDIGYYGNHSLHLFSNIDLNQPVAGQYIGHTSINAGGVTAGNSTGLNVIRPYLGWGPISYSSLQFFSKYNSLQTSLKQRFHNGLTATVNYTWSKSLTNSRTPQNNADLASEYGPTGTNRTSIFNANFVYPLPFFKAQDTLLGRLVGGVQISGIVAAATGAFSTANIGATDPGGLGLIAPGSPGGARPDQVANPNANAPHTFAQWFNKTAFTPTPAGQYRPGNARVQNILGPGYQVWNLTMAKNTRLRDNVVFQLRAEAYNTFNHTNFNGISTTVGATNYGQVTSTGDPRTMQLGAKFSF